MLNPLFSANGVSGPVGANYIYVHSFMCAIDADCWDVAGSVLVLSMYVIDCLFNSVLCLYFECIICICKICICNIVYVMFVLLYIISM